MLILVMLPVPDSTHLGNLDGVLSFELTNAKNYESAGFTEFENDSTGAANVTGEATGGSTTTVVKDAAGWTPDAYIGMNVAVDGKGSSIIIDNDATTLTVDSGSAFSSGVVSGDDFVIGSGEGELGANATIRMWIDINKDGDFDDGTDKVLIWNGSATSSATTGYDTAYYAVSVIEDQEWDATDLSITMEEDDVVHFYIDWKIANNSSVVENNYQGDKVEFDLEFVLTQTPNP